MIESWVINFIYIMQNLGMSLLDLRTAFKIQIKCVVLFIVNDLPSLSCSTNRKVINVCFASKNGRLIVMSWL